MATTFAAEGQHGGMAVGLSSPQGPAVLCVWTSVLGALRSLAAFWQFRDKGVGSQRHCYHGASSNAGPNALVFLRV